jgi:hypothetical protein
MDRRTFNALLSGGTVSIATGLWSQLYPTPAQPAKGNLDGPVNWPYAYRRLLVDTHVPDWDPRLLASFEPGKYIDTIAQAGFQSVMQYAKSHVGLCLWQSKIGPVHANMKGRDYFGEVTEQCRRHGLPVVAYYSLVFDIWSFDHYPDWRILPEDGYEQIFEKRPGVVCPNSPYRERVFSEVRELTAAYSFVGIFFVMTFWPYVCYCPHCSARFQAEHDAEPPRVVNWDDPVWKAFQKARQQWILEFAMSVTKSAQQVRPVMVTHQYSTIFHDWRTAAPLELRDACTYVGGDFYGGPGQYSLACKAYEGLSRLKPFEFHTSRTVNLRDFETTKAPNELLASSLIATLHSAANLIIDSISPDGSLNPEVYRYLHTQNASRAPYEPFLGGDLLADVAIYFDKESAYDPAQNGLRVREITKVEAPHTAGVVGLATILREAHIPHGMVTNVNLEHLENFRAVILSNVLEMTPEQAALFRSFVERGGVLYASGPSSLDRSNPGAPRFLLEEVLGVRYQGMLGKTVTYLSPQDKELSDSIWPQDALSFPGQMVRVEALSGSQVLATITPPWVDPTVGNSLNVHFAQIWNNPPASPPGSAPGIVIHSFGRGKVIWSAAPIESCNGSVYAKVVSTLLRRALPGPYKFEIQAHPSIEMTLFDQPANRRLLVTLLNTDWQLSSIALGATIRALVPAGRAASVVRAAPRGEPISFRRAGPYIEFHLEPFELLAMALVEYQ